MTTQQLFGYISALLSVICYFPYIRDILFGKTKPERASWLIWAVLGFIAFFSQLNKGASNSLWLPGIQTLGVIFILILSIKKGVGGVSKRDIIALLFAALGVVIWFLTQEASYALFIIIIIDAIGGLLTTVKSYNDPESETLSTWFLAGISGLFAAFSVGSWNYILLIYPLYITLINLITVLAILLGKSNKLSHKYKF